MSETRHPLELGFSEDWHVTPAAYKELSDAIAFLDAESISTDHADATIRFLIDSKWKPK